MEMFLGTIVPVAFPFAPRGFMTCAGQLLSIAQNSALFSLLGTTYGGDGQNTFALPDLRGRVAVGAALGASGRIPADMGTVAGNAAYTAVLTGTGAAAVTLTVANMPAHSHSATFAASGGGAPTLHVSTDPATTSQAAAGSYLATSKAGGANQPLMYRADAGSATVALNAASISGGGGGGTVTVDSTGSGTPLQAPVTVSVTGQIPTVPPFVGVQYIICVEGIFPSRN